MKKQFLFLLLSLIILQPVFAQKKTITVEQAIMQRAALSPKRMSQLQWLPGATAFVYVDTLNKAQMLFKGNTSGAVSQMLALKEVNDALKVIGGDTLAKFPMLSFKSNEIFQFTSGTQKYSYDFTRKQLKKADEYKLPDDVDVSEQGPGNNLAYVVGNNIYVVIDGKAKQITPDGGYNIVYGKSVHREEFGIDKGLFWSDNGKKLAFYRMDQSMVTDYPIVDFGPRPAKEKLIKYPFAGQASHHVTLGVYDLETGAITYLKTGEPAEQYLTNIAWRPDSKTIYIAIVNRDQNQMKLNEYSAVTGEFIQTLFEEKDSKYIEPVVPVEFVKGKPTQFIWLSRRDGYNHAYLYDISGKLIRQLTKGNWDVVSVTGMDDAGSKMLVQCVIGGAINRDYAVVNIADGKMKRITQEPGMHTVMMHPSGNYFLDNWSDLRTPGVTVLRDAGGKIVKELNRAINPLENYATGAVRVFPLKGVSGDTLWSRIVLPVDFDSTKKYPAIVYVYGGPHVQLVNNGWMGGSDMSFQALAAKGYIVFTLDNRGTPYRGKAFEQAIHRQLGTCEMQDQMTGVNYLKSLKYVDSTRLGVNGWSFGGFMTTSLMTRNPGVFKVAVAGGPVIDWSMYEVMYTERYMDTPEQNPEGFKNNNLLDYVTNLNGKLMLIHGTSDDVVVWQHSLAYLKKSVSSGVQVDYMVYPGHLHNVTGKDRVHLINKMYNYFEENL
jgi:dipeptidyl-peptidase-4